MFYRLYLAGYYKTAIKNKTPNVSVHWGFLKLFVFLFGGVAGIRTRVQTRKPYAFYMLSFDLILVRGLDQSHRTAP